MIPGADIRHDPTLPWGHWMRTVKPRYQSVVIVDEHGQEWRTLRDAFWRGRLQMSTENSRIVDEGLELILAVMSSKTGARVPFGEDVVGLYGGNDRFYQWHTHWLQAVGLLEQGPGPFGARATSEGASVVRLLLATRPPELAAIPIGAEALRAFGPPDSPTECDRDTYEAADGPCAAYPYAVVREDRWRQYRVAMLHRDSHDVIPMARTIWTVTCPDRATRDRLYHWLYGRMYRWSAWGEMAKKSGSQALTQHLLALIASDPAFGRRADENPAPSIAIDLDARS